MPAARRNKCTVLVVTNDDTTWTDVRTVAGERGLRAIRASGPAGAGLVHARSHVGIIVADADAAPGCWRDCLSLARTRSGDSKVIVIARLATEALWIEVLSAGAADLFAKNCLGGALGNALDACARDLARQQ